MLKGFLTAALLVIITGCSSSTEQRVTTVDPPPQPTEDTTRHAADPVAETLATEPIVHLATLTPEEIELNAAPKPVVVNNWMFGDDRGRVIETPHFRIFTTVSRDWVTEDLPQFYEAAMERYTTAFGALPEPKGRLESYMFADRRQWLVKTREMLPGQSNTYRNLGRGGFTTRGTSVLYYIDYWGRPRDTFAIAAHEGWHMYTQTVFEHALPIWLEEGIAAYMEGLRQRNGEISFQPYRNYERWRALRDAQRRDRLIPLSELIRRSPQSFLRGGKDDLLIYYAQVWALVMFLTEGDDGRYLPAFHEMLQDAAHGRLIGKLLEAAPDDARRGRRTDWLKHSPAAILVYFESSVSDFEERYLAFVTELTKQYRRR